MQTLILPDTTSGNFWHILFRIFMYAGLSNLLVHVIAALVGFHNLRAHKTVRICVPAFIVLMGVINTVTVLFISSLVIAGVYKATGISFNELHGITVGLLQTALAFIFSISRILAML